MVRRDIFSLLITISDFDHNNVIKYCNRPFKNVEEMNNELIDRHNSVVSKNDIVVICGDFSFANKERTYREFVNKLNGTLIFLRGSHDKWMGKRGTGFHEIWEKKIRNYYICCCHYAMATWPRSHYNSFHLYGHSHGNFKNKGKSCDIGVDCHDFYPVVLEKVIDIMKTKEDNFNLIKKVFDD